ncbi:type V CRISPR-associated endonuclease Cas1 [uncultured Eubacterium sp.]|uniref:type V CRISPR-associated endonuclease Cas1 n=1 Tax=Eubacterium sp. TaxID=142586 RepID=UPI0026710B4C|nr:type V CRISPR-associated endonuclease Cas1 [uncultured Eubacterium sp.]
MLNANDFNKKQIIFLFTNQGEKLSFSNDNIIVKDKNGKIKHQSTCYRLFMVCVIGNISITSGLIQRSKRFGFSICLMTTTFKVYEILGARMEGNTLLHKCQYEYDSNDIGRLIEKNKIENQLQALKNIRNKSEYVKDGIKLIESMLPQLNEDIEYLEIMGIEGNAARVYFPRIFDVVTWKGRKPRVKSDYINTTLDIGYTMLFNIVDAILQVYGFDTYYGVFHKCFYMRKSLVCDIMEPMRPIIDWQVRKAINLGQCKEEHFDVYNHRWVLKYKNNPDYIQFLMKAILEYKESIFMYIQSYYRYFMKKKSVTELPRFVYNGKDS